MTKRFHNGECPFCGLHPYEYVDVGIGMMAIAVNCCEWGILYFQYHYSLHSIHKMQREQKRTERKMMAYYREHPAEYDDNSF